MILMLLHDYQVIDMFRSRLCRNVQKNLKHAWVFHPRLYGGHKDTITPEQVTMPSSRSTKRGRKGEQALSPSSIFFYFFLKKKILQILRIQYFSK